MRIDAISNSFLSHEYLSQQESLVDYGDGFEMLRSINLLIAKAKVNLAPIFRAWSEAGERFSLRDRASMDAFAEAASDYWAAHYTLMRVKAIRESILDRLYPGRIPFSEPERRSE